MRNPGRLYQGQPGTTEGTLTTVPAGETWVITDIMVCNTTTNTETFTLSVVPSGDTAGAGNRILKEITLAPNETKKLTGGGTVMEESDFLSGLQSTSAAITLTISGWIES